MTEIESAPATTIQQMTEAKEVKPSIVNSCAMVVASIVCLGIFNLFSIFVFLFALNNINNCPIEPMIPIYLMVSSAVTIIVSVIRWFINFKTEKAKPAEYKAPTVVNGLICLLNVFGFIWLILGLYWTLHVSPVFEQNGEPTYCHYWTYMIAYVSFIILFVLIGATCCCCICASCVAAAALFGDEKDTANEEPAKKEVTVPTTDETA